MVVVGRGNQKDPVTTCYDFLKLINLKCNRALKWDLEKMAGSVEQFRKWFDKCLERHGLVESFQEKQGKRTYTYYKKTKIGELFYETLSYRQLLVVWRRISGKRLKPEYSIF